LRRLEVRAWPASTDNGVVAVAGEPQRLDLKGRERLIRPVAVVR
jgi:hypothetical protein